MGSVSFHRIPFRRISNRWNPTPTPDRKPNPRRFGFRRTEILRNERTPESDTIRQLAHGFLLASYIVTVSVCRFGDIRLLKLPCPWNPGQGSKVTPFNSLHMVSYYSPIVTLCLKCTVFEIWQHIGRKSPKNLPHSHLAYSFGVTLANFSTTHTLPETRIMGLSDGVHLTILLSLC